MMKTLPQMPMGEGAGKMSQDPFLRISENLGQIQLPIVKICSEKRRKTDCENGCFGVHHRSEMKPRAENTCPPRRIANFCNFQAAFARSTNVGDTQKLYSICTPTTRPLARGENVPPVTTEPMVAGSWVSPPWLTLPSRLLPYNESTQRPRGVR
jgi:hypothetical protein